MTTIGKYVAIFALGGIGLSSCVADRTPAFTGSPSYPAGYRDGCASATEADKKFASKVIRDEALFKDDPGYRDGWRQGFVTCQPGRVFQEEQDPFRPSS